MKIERLSTGNLREGVFCAAGEPHGEEVHTRLEGWLQGDILRGQLARADDGEVVGFVLYYPIEEAPMDVGGEGLYMVQCIYVKPAFQAQGVGKALVESALVDAKGSGASGLAMEGFSRQTPGSLQYLPGTSVEHMGLSAGESRGPSTLYYVGFDETAAPPRYLSRSFRPPSEKSKVRIDVLDCSKCVVGVSNREVVKAVENQLGPDEVSVVVHDQNSRKAILDKGMSSGVFVDGKLTFFQGPISEGDVWNAIAVARAARKAAKES